MSSKVPGQPPPGLPTRRYSMFQVAIAFGGQRGAEVSGVGQIVFGAPEASVDVHHHGEWTLGLGKAKVCRTDWDRVP